MKLRWLLWALCLVLVIDSCKKDTNNSPSNPIVKKNIIGTFSVSNVLQSNMVVQRDKPFNIWGVAPAAAKVTVNVSWNTNTFTATADAAGNWLLAIPAAAVNANPQAITVNTDGFKQITLGNILIGDVWICSGQSNMVYEMAPESPFDGVTDYQDEITAANYPAIRALTVQPDAEANPSDSLNSISAWTICSPQTVGNISGVAYYFARKLYTGLNVPIGIVVSAVDGTSCEAWINRAGFAANPDIAKYSGINSATLYYNGMINPFIKLSIKGFTWYQGENNKADNPVSDYTHLNMALIEAWRNVFNQGSLPFYFVQMTPFDQDYYNTTPAGGDMQDDTYAKFREAQTNVLAETNTGMAVTMDVGEVTNQHPPDKKPVGERLALLALKNTYEQDVQCYGPQFLSYTVSGNTATISFKPGTADGLNTINNNPIQQFFYVAGTSQTFFQASAVISGSQIVLTAPANMPQSIAAIRYAFTVAPITNLQNSAGLPMEPFRTDNWSN